MKTVKQQQQQLPIQMLKLVLTVRLQPKQQHHRKGIVVIEVDVLAEEEIEIEHVVSMVRHQRRIEKIEELPLLQQQQRKQLIQKVTMVIKIIMHIIVSDD